jgi:cbb3-type cytochrome oxidase subunit 3
VYTSGVVTSSHPSNSYVGGLIGEIGSSNVISAAASTSIVISKGYAVGGLIGYVSSNNSISNSFATGSVTGLYYVGGLIGYANSNNSIESTFSVGLIAADSLLGGLIGRLDGESVINNNYWASDTSGQDYSAGRSEASSYIGLNLSALKCATAENTDSSTGCVSADGSGEDLSAAVILYKDWDPAVWDFGTAPNASQQLPGLKFGDRIIRDGDGDGILDDDDAWPNNRAASKDLDEDGYPDEWSSSCDHACITASGLILDQFPNHAWAAVDADFDGLPDSVENCINDCELDGLTKDSFLGDYDNDGILDAMDTDEYGVPKVDMNGNGLIDIDSLDKLNAMRFQLQGAGLQLTAVSTVEISGCPFILYQGNYQQRCSGYELTQDLDFDTNADGIIDENDDYWNESLEGIGEGWLPVGIYDKYDDASSFNARFNGNGHVIKNLTINRPNAKFVGLFGSVNDSYIENLVISGPLTSVVGSYYVGALVGLLSSSKIENVLVAAQIQGQGQVKGQGAAAGLAGSATNSSFKNISVSGSVIGTGGVGGLIGDFFFDKREAGKEDLITIVNIISSSVVSGNYGNSDGLIGYASLRNLLLQVNISNSYWATDISTQSESYGSSEENSYVGLSLAKLQCATSANTNFTSGCVSEDGSDEGLSAGVTLYQDWDPAVWDFGTAPDARQQLPGLKFNGEVFRDGDGDGLLDVDDAWPNNRAASKDLDADGYPDEWSSSCDDACITASGLILDQFPNHTWAAIDADFDGLPDGAENCVSDCELDGLTKDSFLGDYDNDGILDAVDTDEYGVPKVDMNGNGLIDIDSLDKLNAMRYQLQGIGLQLEEASSVVTSGCPFLLYQGNYQQRCSGYELTQDLNFDTNADGIIDENDDYWNESLEGIGEGWLPVGIYDEYEDASSFNARFNGHGHAIKNLTINRPEKDSVGLFGSVNNSYIENLIISGSLTRVVGSYGVGALVGKFSNSKIQNIVVAARVQGRYVLGGVAGSGTDSSLENISVSGSVIGFDGVGGLIGRLGNSDLEVARIDYEYYTLSSIVNVVSSSVVSGNGYDIGGLIGAFYSGHQARNITPQVRIRNSYWATDVSTQFDNTGSSAANSYVGLSLAKLQCATSENTNFTSGCVSEDGSDEGLSAAVTVYQDWDPAVWDFGTAPNASQQLPGLKFNGQVFRDGDGDGLLDVDDSFLFDHDNDGILDVVDVYPFISIGGLADLDGDGIPNDCDQACLDLGMVADADDDNDGSIDIDDFYPLIAVGSLDTDFDGIPNDCDQACLDLGMVADTDDDNDGSLDAVDVYPLIAVGSLDTDLDGIPNDCDQACFDLGMVADTDDDNDGTFDVADAYPLIAAGSLDTDLDGIPNDCDQACLDLGMVADTDDDNDGSLDTVDAYPFIAVGSLDTDFDGIPNDCDQACIDLGMVADIDDDNDGSIDSDDFYPLIAVGSLDTDLDGIPNDCDQACIDLGMVADTDDDNDGSLDALDAYPLIAAGGLDSDLDGIPNDCDQACLDLGMVADTDDDNDGLLDELDGYPLVALGGLADFDNDGIPDNCDQACLDLGMLADIDNDNDGSIDSVDAYPFIAVGSLDTDQDGIPNDCDQACLDLGMVADTDDDNDGSIDVADEYPLIATGSLDSDLDGIPNDCDQACLNLGMIADIDDDNDGLLDELDGYPLIALGGLADFDNDGIPDNCDQACLDLGMLADIDNDNDGSIDSVDAYPLIAAGSLDSDLDGIPNDCDQACLDLGMVADTDDDNDGSIDVADAYPLIAAGSLDSDLDGIPNDCDQACLDLGMIADADDDNDGVLDVNDGYRLIAIGELTDTDRDGIPNNCDQACLDLGMAADADDDNDGSLDSFDAYPLIAAGSLDTDRDGIPNNCDQACINLGMVADTDDDNDGLLDTFDGYPLAPIGGLADFDNDGRPDICNQACIALGMAADADNDNDGIANAFDAFEFNAAAAIDSDNDGLVDGWNANCLNACQLDSGLVLDSYTNDTDNDGATNDVDSDFENDNGKPTLLTVAPTVYASVNTESGAALTLMASEVDGMFAALSAVDVIDLDASLSFKAYFNNAELVRDNDGQVTLPSGLQVIDWVAVDQAGNESEPLTQQLFIYPQVRFNSASSITGEASNAEIIIELSGDSPEYPVIIEVSIDAEASSIDQADLAAEFDISSVHTVSIEQGNDAELLNKQVSLFVPVKEDNESENDELLVIELNSVMAASEGDATFLMDENKKVHELTVTYQNLAPTVQLLIQQAGVEVSDIKQEGGDVTITAIITDGNGHDEHSLIWDLNALGLNAPLGHELTFNPAGLSEGVYELSVSVTDNNPVNPLSASIEVSIQLLVPVVVPPVDAGPGSADSSSGGSSGGGAMFWLLIFMSAALVYSNRRYSC